MALLAATLLRPRKLSRADTQLRPRASTWHPQIEAHKPLPSARPRAGGRA
ncbi:hypothetical protein SSAG_00334 [Streptomyces sp. Mg1]|nr:hypothetical protein SSAG_00334 [Streptomyces sp. Mg1]